MLAERLVKIASTIVFEYKKFGIIALMSKAASLSAERPSLKEAAFAATAIDIRKSAERIRTETIIRSYPSSLSKLLSESEFGVYLPASIASMLIAGFPDAKSGAMSSGEVNMYIDGAKKLIVSLDNLITFSHSLHVKPSTIQNDVVAIDFIVTRNMIDNGLVGFSSKIRRFADWVQCIDEIVSGLRKDPEIFSISTTDPMITIAAVPATAMSLLYMYKFALEIAEKNLNITKLVRDLKKTEMNKINIGDYEEDLKKIITKHVNEAVENMLKNMACNAEESRVNELRSTLEKSTLNMVDDISAGARMQISLESLDNLSLIASSSNMSASEFVEEVDNQKNIEEKLRSLQMSLSNPLLISSKELIEERGVRKIDLED